jgi:hypothetical protein
MAERPLVTFLIAGAQKAGTTALYDYLAEAGDIALSRVKETHFFDDESQDWARPDYGAYHAQFDDPAGRPCGEATPIYVYWPNAMERIAAYNPAMKLILLLRDPVARAWSNWKMEFARGPETRPFAWAIREGRMRLFDAEPWGFHREFSYVERGFYADQLERVFGLFPRDQVLILTAEALRDDPAPVLAEVRKFLGLSIARPPAPLESHVAQEMDYGSELTEADVALLRRLYARDQARLAALIGLSYG